MREKKAKNGKTNRTLQEFSFKKHTLSNEVMRKYTFDEYGLHF